MSFLELRASRPQQSQPSRRRFFSPRLCSTLLNRLAAVKTLQKGAKRTRKLQFDCLIQLQFPQPAILHHSLLSHFCLLALIRRCSEGKTKKKQSTNFVINFYWKAWLPENVFLDFFFASRCCTFCCRFKAALIVALSFSRNFFATQKISSTFYSTNCNSKLPRVCRGMDGDLSIEFRV